MPLPVASRLRYRWDFSRTGTVVVAVGGSSALMLFSMRSIVSL
jgi:hypothetical protein